jgi:hypothetical protein
MGFCTATDIAATVKEQQISSRQQTCRYKFKAGYMPQIGGSYLHVLSYG